MENYSKENVQLSMPQMSPVHRCGKVLWERLKSQLCQGKRADKIQLLPHDYIVGFGLFEIK